MDGIRAYWDGNNLWTRHGVEIQAPEEFIRGLPTAIPLDGELWMGRATFEYLASSLNRSSADHNWNATQYCIFDLPSQMKPYKERMQLLKGTSLPSQVNNGLVSLRSKFCVVPHFDCLSNSHLIEELESVLDIGGEGLIAHNPFSVYEPGRTNAVLKIKVLFGIHCLCLSAFPGHRSESSWSITNWTAVPTVQSCPFFLNL